MSVRRAAARDDPAASLRYRVRAALWGDGPLAFATRARRRRMQMLLERVPDLAERRVLDLGGTPASWATAPVRPAHVTCVNLKPHAAKVDGFTIVEGDATRFPELVEAGDHDLLYSNSLIEHVGGAGPRRRMADAVVDSGLDYWVQAPYRHFPLEPHWTLPLWQYLPRHWQVPLGARYRYGDSSPATLQHTYDVLAMLELPTMTDMRYLFPGAELVRERAFGMTKSLIAMRTRA